MNAILRYIIVAAVVVLFVLVFLFFFSSPTLLEDLEFRAISLVKGQSGGSKPTTQGENRKDDQQTQSSFFKPSPLKDLMHDDLMHDAPHPLPENEPVLEERSEASEGEGMEGIETMMMREEGGVSNIFEETEDEEDESVVGIQGIEAEAGVLQK